MSNNKNNTLWNTIAFIKKGVSNGRQNKKNRDRPRVAC